MAISRYLARKHGLNGSGEAEAARIDVVNEGVTDMYNKWGIAKFHGEESKREAEVAKFVKEELPVSLGYFSKIYEKNNKTFLVGNKLSYADLHLFQALEKVRKEPGVSDVLARFSVKELYDKVAALPKIKAYQQSKPYA